MCEPQLVDVCVETSRRLSPRTPGRVAGGREDGGTGGRGDGGRDTVNIVTVSRGADGRGPRLLCAQWTDCSQENGVSGGEQ